MLVSRKQVESNLGQVTSDQIARCTKVFDFQLKANVYMVLSERDDLTEYRVTYDKQHGFRCGCPSGANGFSNVKHPSGVCKHVRYSVAAAQEEKARETARLAKSAAIALAHSCGMEICSTEDCLQLASKVTGQCVAHNGKITDTGMLAFCAARAKGLDINLGRPDWMMK